MTRTQPFCWKDIRVSFQGGCLTVENRWFRRILDLSRGIPATRSFVYLPDGLEIAEAENEGDFSLAGYNMPWHTGRTTSFRFLGFRAVRRRATTLAPERVVLSLSMSEDVQQLDIVREYTIYPDCPFLSCRLRMRSAVHPLLYWTPRADLNGNRGIAEFPSTPDAFRETCIERVRLRPALKHCRSIEFFGRTDYENRVVAEHVLRGDAVTPVRGNLLFCEFDGHGMVWIQDAPVSTERRDPEPYDFRVGAGEIHSCGSGVAPHEVMGRSFKSSYAHTLCLYRGGADEAERALKECMRHRFPENPERDYCITVNPWGGGRFIEKISEPFLAREIRAAARLGADLYQVDDGWQEGGSLPELTRNNRSAGPGFWRISQRHFGGSFQTLSETAHSAGTGLALWFAPDANCDFSTWRTQAGLLLDLHRRYGISCFKLDGIRVRTKRAEENLERLLRTVHVRSHGRVRFHFDTTNGQRPGYWLFLEYGSIFLENRYVNKPWGVGYHPETVLRNLWRLARYVRPQKLQIEIADPGIIHRDFYRSRAMAMPDLYPPSYWAAVAFVAQPLGWFNPSALHREVRREYRRVLALHRRLRDDLFAGEIYPVGKEPDGRQVTGFQSYRPEERTGYLLLFRERGAPARARIRLRFLKDEAVRFEDIGDGSAGIVKKAGAERLAVDLPAPASYRLFRYGRA